ncbi:alpha-2,8-polysialyltransferase family protein [Mannheimia indoligenes]|uniref:Alpha-2,8-polysialyltransferase family protein n=1 Tax=Mannheimia indoligenes TaxID=3103145 RepID=A0ABU7ZFY1_9PAST
MKKKLKKTIKFYSHPIRFFKDSWLFKHQHLEEQHKTKNLFVISHLGQLAQVEALIKKEAFLNCVLVILYTRKNRKMPELTRKNANKLLFRRVLLLEIPTYPNKIYIKNLMQMNNSYQRMIDEIKPHRLFVFSFEKHYGMLLAYAEKKKIEVNLIEEGTATYKYDSIEEANEKIKNSFSFKEKLKARLILTLPLLSDLRPSLSVYNRFNTIYSVDSKALEKVFFAKNYKYFFLYENIETDVLVKSIQQKYKITSQDIIFLNQRYPFPVNIYADILIDILKSHKPSGSKVFLKLHPKDTEELKAALKNAINEEHLIPQFVLIEESGFLVENLIHFTKPKQVIALTSTGLVYAPKTSQETEAISIYPLLRQKMLEKIPYSDSVFKESDEHFHILQKFSGIHFLE